MRNRKHEHYYYKSFYRSLRKGSRSQKGLLYLLYMDSQNLTYQKNNIIYTVKQLKFKNNFKSTKKYNNYEGSFTLA